MARYAVTNTQGGATIQALATSYKTMISLTAATGATTLRRAWINYWYASIYDTPADNMIMWKIDRQTDVGTATAVAAGVLESGDAAALITENINNSVEPTVVSSTQLIEVPVNQRVTYQWMAAPQGELVVPATNTTGLGLRAKSLALTSTTATCGMHFYE
jgi:hypothetical protein